MKKSFDQCDKIWSVRPTADSQFVDYTCASPRFLRGFGRTTDKEPTLICAYPDPLTVNAVFTRLLDKSDEPNWEAIDTGNWSFHAVDLSQPQKIGGITYGMREEGSLFLVKIRKLSTAQHERANDAYYCCTSPGVPIFQVQIPDLQGNWPNESEYNPIAAINEAQMSLKLGDLI